MQHLDISKNLPEWQTQLIDQILNLFAAYYCLPEKVLKAERKLALDIGFKKINQAFQVAKQSDAKFMAEFFGRTMPDGKLLSESGFLDRVNQDILLKIDAHLSLSYRPELIARDRKRGKGIIFDTEKNCAYFHTVVLPPEKQTAQDELKDIEFASKENFGFLVKPPLPSEDFICMEKWEKEWVQQIPDESHKKIPVDVGYIRINSFYSHSLPPVKETADQIMSAMQNKKAIILDLRYHVGGDPRMVEKFVSYFFKEKDALIDSLQSSMDGAIEEFRILDQPFKLLGMPVYILTSKVTCSAGEALAYNLQQMSEFNVEGTKGRFTLIGQTTAGGAHSYYIFPLVDFSNDNPTVNEEIVLWVPIRLNKNAYSHTNWEDQACGKGVHPKIVIQDHESALDVTLDLIREDRLLKTARLTTHANLYPNQNRTQPKTQPEMTPKIENRK